MPLLNDILAGGSRGKVEDCALIRGAILRSPGEGKLIVQRTPSSWREWAEFQLSDVVRGPWKVEPYDLDPAEYGHDVYDIGIRKRRSFRALPNVSGDAVLQVRR